MNNIKYRALLGLILVFITIIWQIDWLWGVFFLIWLIPDLLAKETHFFEQVTRRDNPMTYWAIMFTWLVLSVYLLLNPSF